VVDVSPLNNVEWYWVKRRLRCVPVPVDYELLVVAFVVVSVDAEAGKGAAVAADGADEVSLGAVVAEVEVEDGSGLESIVGEGSEAKDGG
jgi:hypothetical protein